MSHPAFRREPAHGPYGRTSGLDGRRTSTRQPAPSCRMKRLVLASLILIAAAPVTEDALLAQLKSAPDSRAASRVEEALIKLWHDQATPAVQILIDQAILDIHTGHQDAALENVDAAIALQPADADLWRRRAELRFAAGEQEGAIADLAQALSRNPHLLPALIDLSRFSELRHDNRRALEAWQQVLDIDPMIEGGQRSLDKLNRAVEGQPI